MLNLINSYLKDKELAWAPSTLKSERARLQSLIPYIDGNADALWAHISSSLKPYSRVTTWTRVSNFWSFIHPSEVNPYEAFRKKNARLFKHAYIPKTVGISFKEAVQRINTLLIEEDRTLALQILGSGERYHEAIQASNHIIGKGSKPREVYRPEASSELKPRSYSSFLRSLKSIGLTPHALRKLCATKLVEEGIKEIDLLRIMGWNSIMTAKSYLQPKADSEIKKLFSVIHKEITS